MATIAQDIIAPSPRAYTVASAGATLTIDADSYDGIELTGQGANLTIAAPIGTPVKQQRLLIRIKDDGTARTITWNAIFAAIGVTLPATTVVGKITYVLALWNSTTSKWDVLAAAVQA